MEKTTEIKNYESITYGSDQFHTLPNSNAKKCRIQMQTKIQIGFDLL